MQKMADSRFFPELLKNYPRSPSIAMCRVPELELLSKINLEFPVLDHCCGDGYIAATAFPGVSIDAGIDIDPGRLSGARARGNYRKVLNADATQELPFTAGTFSTVFNNSGIEHIEDLSAAIHQLARVIRPGGRLFLNVLNSRYFDHWPGSQADAASYRDWQPFFHALSEEEWRVQLGEHGFVEVTFEDYLPVESARKFAELDFRYSGLFLRERFSLKTLLEVCQPASLLERRWRAELGDYIWEAEAGAGCGFLIQAIRAN